MKLASTLLTCFVSYTLTASATPVIRRQTQVVPAVTPAELNLDIIGVLLPENRTIACNEECLAYDISTEKLGNITDFAEQNRQFFCNNTVIEEMAACLRCGIAENPNVNTTELQAVQNNLERNLGRCEGRGLAVEIPNLLASGGSINQFTGSLLGFVGAFTITFMSL